MFRRPLRRRDVMRNLRILEASGFFDPPEKSRARPQLAEDERSGGEARVEDPRQCLLPL